MIEFKHVSKTYINGNGTEALHDINLQIENGEFVFIIGSSGAGKSTLLKLIMCEEKPGKGTLRINNFHLESLPKRKIPELRRTMGIVFQDFRLLQQMTVYDNVAFAMRAIGEREKAVKERVPRVLNMLGIGDKADCMPGNLSGGERQRVALARALVNDADIILADEPTGNVDPRMSCQLIELLMELNKLGKTIIVVTHEHSLVRKFTYRTIEISKGIIISDRPARGKYAKMHSRAEKEISVSESNPASESEDEDDEFMDLGLIQNYKEYGVKRMADIEREYLETRFNSEKQPGGKQ